MPEHRVCTSLGFRGFASASSLLPSKSQALADLQYLHCVLHPDSRLHQWPEQIHPLAAVRHCCASVCPAAGCSCPRDPAASSVWQQGNVGTLLCPSVWAPCPCRAVPESCKCGTDKSHQRQNQVRQCPLMSAQCFTPAQSRKVCSEKSAKAAAACASRMPGLYL